MSALGTPAAATRPSSVTPGTALVGTRIFGGGFDPDILDIMVTLIDPEDPTTNDAVKEGLNELFTRYWKTKRWYNLQFFSSADVEMALRPDGPGPDALKDPVIVKKLSVIIDYAGLDQVLTPDSNLGDMMKQVTAAKQLTYKTSTPNESPSHRSVQIFDKKAVPTLEKFSGRDEDYYTWRESTINILGTAGYGDFVEEDDMAGRHPEIAKSVFYALRTAVYGGEAQSIAQAMLDDKVYDPFALWMQLETYYDTSLNRANIVLYEIRRLFNLRLVPDTTATKFISDYRDCMQRLRKHKVRLAEDNDALRAFLLSAIQDDDFECVRDSIVKAPNSGVDTILKEIREREYTMKMREDPGAPNPVRGDGTTTSRHSRRTQQSNSTQGSGPRGGYDATTSKGNVRWNIPRVPDSWKQAFGASLFKLLLDWRTEAHKGKSQTQLNEDFTTFVEKVNQHSSRANKQGKVRSRRMSTGTDATESSTSLTSNNHGTRNDGDNQSTGTDDDDVQKRKRIRLNKSRRIVTERNA